MSESCTGPVMYPLIYPLITPVFVIVCLVGYIAEDSAYIDFDGLTPNCACLCAGRDQRQKYCFRDVQ